MYVTPNCPNGGTKRDFAVLLVKFNFCTKFLCVKTSSGRVIATSFPYLTAHRRIAGDVPIYLKFALKVTHPFSKRRFRQIRFYIDSYKVAAGGVILMFGSSFPSFFVSVPCARLIWPYRQLLSARKYIVSYRIVHLAFSLSNVCTIYCVNYTCNRISLLKEIRYLKRE